MLLLLYFFGLIFKFLFYLFLLRIDKAEVLGFYGLLSAIEAIFPYILGFELHTFSTRRYVRNPTKRKFSIISSLHYTHLMCAAPIAIIITPLLMMYLEATSSNIVLFFSGIIVAMAVILQETTRAMILVKKPKLSVVITFIRGGLWLPICGVLIWQTAWDPFLVLTGCWLLFNFVALLFSVNEIGFVELPKVIRNKNYIFGAIGYSKSYYIVALAGAIVQNADKIILQAVIGLNGLGLYTLYQSLASSIAGAVQSVVVNRVMYDLLSVASKSKDKLDTLVRKTARKSFFIALALAGIVMIAPYPVAFLTAKNELLDNYTVLMFLLVAQIFSISSQSYHLAIYALQKDELLTKLMLTGMIIALMFLVLGSCLAGIQGASFGVMLASIGMSTIKIKFYKNMILKDVQ